MLTYTLTQYVLIGLIMTFGGVVQGAVGFGSGLLGVPLLILAGFSIPEAATINLVSTSVQNSTGAWKLWPHLDKDELWFPVIVRLFAIPCGVYAAYLIDQRVEPGQIKQLIGFLLLIIVSLLWGFRVEPREHLNHWWQFLAFSTSGFLMGFAAIGGAPMVMYVNALTWSAYKSRAFMFFCSAIALPVVVTSYLIKHGSSIFPPALATLLLMPLILMGLRLGFQLGHHISKPLFRRITYLMLLLVAVSAILSPIFTK